jgi:hypothetical protein
MDLETIVGMDCYILFGDIEDSAPIDYEERCMQEDFLITDKTSYVWGYVGVLSLNQVAAVRTRLNLEFYDRFFAEFCLLGCLDLSTEYGFEFDFTNADYKKVSEEPAIKILEPLTEISPDLNFFAWVLPHHRFWVFPKMHETLRMLEAISSLPRRNNFDYSALMPLSTVQFAVLQKNLIMLKMNHARGSLLLIVCQATH